MIALVFDSISIWLIIIINTNNNTNPNTNTKTNAKTKKKISFQNLLVKE